MAEQPLEASAGSSAVMEPGQGRQVWVFAFSVPLHVWASDAVGGHTLAPTEPEFAAPLSGVLS